jgi:hypothetical protein
MTTMTPREFAACVFWTAAFVVMVFGTAAAASRGEGDRIALCWGVFLAIAAHQLTSWAIIRTHHAEQEVSVEKVVEIVDALHTPRRDLPRLH